ncbi:uncharacterized protein LOC112046156 [Bicyclus anynana]|uniref:Uncharacterized protein LOC112046156 n=1 Tax=Bicyclus anynana TaxID=110368 RepID=A0ABM3LF38_BICAN|nr:uncharacterized protein LOC112046156 [Bicyclus anynana]
MGFIFLSLWLWLLPATVLLSPVPELQEEQEEHCRTYTHEDLLHLDCTDRGLSDLPSGLDYNAQVLLLSNNNFATFPEQLQNFHQAETLDLSGNRLTSALPNYILGLQRLNSLNLSNNNYDSWLTIESTFNIQKLDLSKNKINRIDEDAFVRMSRLTYLDLSENRINNLPLGIFAKTTGLEVIILSRNYFSEVPKFQSPSLRILHLSNCQITNLDTNSMTEMPTLLEINLSLNEIESIPDNLASNSLQELDLSYNEIATINDQSFSSLPHLAVLDLRGNEFKEVWSTSHFASNPFLREVRVKGNRWSCEGFRVNMLLTYEFLTKEPPKVQDRGSLICYSPQNVSQLSWQQAYIRTWHADENGTPSYTLMAVLFGMLIGTLITSCVCRGIMALNPPQPRQTTPETTALNGNATQRRPDSVQLRIPLREELPPSYDEALLMPRLNASFHSLPDFVDEEDSNTNNNRRYRRSRSIGDLTETRPRVHDRRSVRRTVDIDVMILLRISGLLLLIWLAHAQMLDLDDHTNEICYLCSCNTDKTSVDCSHRGLTGLPVGINAKVTKLNISNNEISTFPENMYELYNLISLDMSGNQLKELPQNALQNLTALEILDLSRNSFESWISLNPNEVLKPATNLKTVNLSKNKFKTLANLANHELLISSSLETLILENCEIDSIHGRSPLSGLTSISVLKLNNNPLLRIQNLISPSLKSLYVSNCQLSIINHNELAYLPSLVFLKMSHNYRLQLSPTADYLYSSSLRYLDISYCNVFKPNLFGFPNLRKVIVNHNMIRFLRSNEFSNNTKLEYLDLSNNNIGSMKSDTFRGLTMLRYLDLSWNEIAHIPEDSLLEMPSLTQIKLARNYLNRVGHLKSMSLSKIDMNSCEINMIGKDSLEGLPSLVDLDLSRNLLSHIPDSISSNTLKYLNLNYNRITSVNNLTFFMLPRLAGLGVIGNRFTNIWSRTYFDSNPYLDRLDLGDNMWRCDCADGNMFDFYEFVTLEPNKKEESYNLICNSPVTVIGQTWLEACYFVWNPSERVGNADNLVWFIIVMIVGLSLCIILINTIRRSMNRRLAAMQAERERQVEEARDRLRQLRIRAEQEALCNTPDPRDLIAPPSYDEALSMPKLNVSCQSLNETGTGKTKRRRGRRKTKSSGDLLEETERNGDIPVLDDIELAETTYDKNRRRRRRNGRYGSHEIAELEQSPGARRRRLSEHNNVIEVEAELERPLRPRLRRFSDENLPRESDF